MAANGESENDGRDRSSNYYAETIVIPTQQAATAAPKKKTAPVEKAPAKPKNGGAYAAPAAKDNTYRRSKNLIITISALSAVLVLCICIGLWFYFASTADNGLIPGSWTVARQVPLSIRCPRQEYWSGLPFPSPGDLPDPGIEPVSCLAGRFLTTEPPGNPKGFGRS